MNNSSFLQPLLILCTLIVALFIVSATCQSQPNFAIQSQDEQPKQSLPITPQTPARYDPDMIQRPPPWTPALNEQNFNQPSVNISQSSTNLATPISPPIQEQQQPQQQQQQQQSMVLTSPLTLTLNSTLQNTNQSTLQEVSSSPPASKTREVSGEDDGAISTIVDADVATNTGKIGSLPKLSTTSSSSNSNLDSAIKKTLPITPFLSSATSPAVNPLLIYSIRYEIRSYDLSSSVATKPNSFSSTNSAFPDQHPLSNKHSPTKTLIAGLKNTIGLDFYYSENDSYIFWTDVIEERIYKGTIVNGTITNVDMVVQTGLATAEGLAVDWIGMNIYWVESTLDHIEVANMNGSSRRTLIAGDMESPRAIAVDPRYGYLFWSDWDKKSPRIERATMSGEDRRTLVHIKEVNGGWPNGLTLDYDSLKIYWIDANSDSIHVVDYEGNNPNLILRKIKTLGHPFSITLYDNTLYWTDWKTNSVSMANKNDGSDPRELQRLTNRLFDIKVFHPSRQPRIPNHLNPCYINNGNCSHLCLLSTNYQRKCECPHLMKLTADNKTCETYERVLLIGRTHEIRAVDISEPLHHIMAPISVPKVFNPKHFEFDAKTKSIFWADHQTNEVRRASLSGGSIDIVIDVIIEAPSGLALDWMSRNLYVSSSPQHKSSPGKIFISNINGEYISILMDGSQGIISPKSLAVHPSLGILFCVDENENSEPIIFAASMDGKNKRIIASRQNDPSLSNPSNLAIDSELNRVYWINQAISKRDQASLQYYDILKDEIITVFDEAEQPVEQRINPGVICVDGDNLIMSSQNPTEAIIRAWKYNVTDPKSRTTFKTQNLDQILALKVYNASTQVGTNACSINNGNCSQLCVPMNSTNRACKCTMGYSINPSNEVECLGKDTFLILSYNLGMKGISIEPNSSPDDYYLPPIHRAFRASSIDFLHRENLIYWVDNEEGSITRINRDTTNYQVVVQGLESEECVCVDWVAGNIYWLDPYYDIIEVARLNGSNRYVIVSGDMDKANGIVVNPLKGYIVWSDIGSMPKIEIAKLDGSNRRIIVSSNLTHVDDLAIDYAEDYIYWVDSTLQIIERIKEDGTGRQVIYNGSLNYGPNHHLVSIAIYKEYLYVADSAQNQGSIIRFNKADASNPRVIQHHLGDGIRDMAIYAEQPIPSPAENPCAFNNGGCQDLCLFRGKPGKKRCICSHGKLKSDGLTCKSYDNFILFSKLSQIDSLHIPDEESFNNAPYPPIAIENRSSIISLTVDYSNQRVIYSDITRNQICSIGFNGKEKRVLVEKQNLVEGIAFANDQLYWTSIQDNSISRLNTTSMGVLKKTCDKNGVGCKTASVEKIVKLSHDDKPRGIAIDTCTQYVYWTNWNNNASIQRASPHNGYKIESIIKTDIRVPNGLAIDYERRKLYWCDARLDKIETCNMDGTNRKVLTYASPQHPFALAVWRNYVFWTDWLARGVFKADKYTGLQLTQIKKVSQRPMGIAVAAPEVNQCPVDHCSIDNGRCQPGYTCISHETTGAPMIVCREPNDLGHDLSLPARKSKIPCRFAGDTMCKDSYHDVILDGSDRYTELTPIETKSVGYETTVSPIITEGAIVTQPPSVSPINEIPTQQVITTSTETVTNPLVTSSVTSNRDSAQASSMSTTLPPCQIVSTLQPTTESLTEDCKNSSEFRCYLSTKPEELLCIPLKRKCDGNYDCPKREDENDCHLSKMGQYSIKQETNWHRFVTVILIILAAALAAIFLVFGNRGRRRWFVHSNGFSSHRKMFDDSGTNIEISNPMFDEDDSANLIHCAFSIDLNERTTNFSNPLYEQQASQTKTSDRNYD